MKSELKFLSEPERRVLAFALSKSQLSFDFDEVRVHERYQTAAGWVADFGSSIDAAPKAVGLECFDGPDGTCKPNVVRFYVLLNDGKLQHLECVGADDLVPNLADNHAFET